MVLTCPSQRSKSFSTTKQRRRTAIARISVKDGQPETRKYQSHAALVAPSENWLRCGGKETAGKATKSALHPKMTSNEKYQAKPALGIAPLQLLALANTDGKRDRLGVHHADT